MGFVKKVMSFLGISRDDGHATVDSTGMVEDEGIGQQLPDRGRRGGGFSVKVPMRVERAHLGPVLVECPQGDGGIQGLNWCYPRLRMDEDGDVANEFLEVDESALQSPNASQGGLVPKSGTQALQRGRVNEVAVVDGKVLHSTNVQGTRGMWI